MSPLAEAGLEDLVLEDLADLGWTTVHGPDIAPGEQIAERNDYRETVLGPQLREALVRLNPGLPADAIDEAAKTVLRAESQVVLTENWRAYQLLVAGVPVEYRHTDGSIRSVRAKLIDFDNPSRNTFWAVNQFTVQGSTKRRPDVVLFVNGLPLGLQELKRPGQPNATIKGAFNQIKTYVAQIPDIFTWNQVTIISDGVQARAATFTAGWEHYAPWKAVDDASLADPAVPQITTLVRGMLEPARFLDLVRNFIVFSDETSGVVKRVAKYHQFWAVNKAVERTVEAKSGDGRAGVVWHTQGSGKSLEMHCFAGKIMRDPAMANPTLIVLTDRNDLDDQLFSEVFGASRPGAPLPEVPVQADSRKHLKELLDSRASGGIVFTTIQKFGLSKEDRDAGRSFPELSGRSNIVVMVDEAHRSNYDFIDGFARHLRDGLPNATYIGFTGTPIENGDKNTRQVFGDYIDVYDLTQAVEDGATVKVYYEPRLARVELPAAAVAEIDEEFADACGTTEEDTQDRLKSKWAKIEAIVGSDKRVKALAADIVTHWEARKDALAGKAMVVAMSRRIAVALYDEIVALRPD
ncbi:MAG TPA: type I restriction endonuclease subunit R, partial [Microthrixaceae bacterium]|nr:type I restriction endonuclease subunit R [Microthrixaceae bacterium]